MMRTRNFRVRTKVVEREQSPRVKRERKPYVERKVGVFSVGRHMDNVQEETHEVSVMRDKYKETCTVVRDEKDDRLPSHQIWRPRLTKEEKNPQTHPATERKALQTKGAKFRAVTFFWKKKKKKRHSSPCVKTTSLRPDANLEEHVSSDMLRLRKSQQELKKRWCESISCIIEGVYTIRLYLKILIRQILFYVKKENCRNIFTSSRMRTKVRFTLPLKQGQCRRLLQNLQRSENSWSIQHQCTWWAKKS